MAFDIKNKLRDLAGQINDVMQFLAKEGFEYWDEMGDTYVDFLSGTKSEWFIKVNSKKLPGKQINREEIEILWTSAYYDGPLSGLCKINNTEYWFNSTDMDEFPRLYLVYALTQEQYEIEKYWHDLFRKMVDRNADYKDGVRQNYYPVGDSCLFEEYYEKRKEKPELNLKENEVIGWFSSECNAAGVAFDRMLLKNLEEKKEQCEKEHLR